MGGCLTWARMMPEKAGLASTFSAGIRARTSESCSREPHRTAVLLPEPGHWSSRRYSGSSRSRARAFHSGTFAARNSSSASSVIVLCKLEAPALLEGIQKSDEVAEFLHRESQFEALGHQ